MKNKEKEKVISLRKQGLSYNQIVKKVKVSKGSVSLWCKNIVLTNEQKTALEQNSRIASINSGRKNKVRWDKLKEELLATYDPPFGNPNFMLGLGLYWGEGSKNQDTCMVNADLWVLKFFISWINEFFSENSFSVRVQHYTPLKDFEIKKYWSESLNIPLSCFIKSSFAISKSSQRKRKTLPYGTVCVRCKGKKVWQIKQKINKALALMKS